MQVRCQCRLPQHQPLEHAPRCLVSVEPQATHAPRLPAVQSDAPPPPPDGPCPGSMAAKSLAVLRSVARRVAWRLAGHPIYRSAASTAVLPNLNAAYASPAAHSASKPTRRSGHLQTGGQVAILLRLRVGRHYGRYVRKEWEGAPALTPIPCQKKDMCTTLVWQVALGLCSNTFRRSAM